MKASSTKCWQRAEASNAFALGFLSPFRRKLPLSRGVDCQHDFSTDFRHCRHGFLPNLKILNRRTDYGLHADAEAANGCCVPDPSLPFPANFHQPTEGANGFVRSPRGSPNLPVSSNFPPPLPHKNPKTLGLRYFTECPRTVFEWIAQSKFRKRDIGRPVKRPNSTDLQPSSKKQDTKKKLGRIIGGSG